MRCIKKHSGLLKGALLTFGVLMIITIASPLSVSLKTGELFSLNIAYAQTPCGLGDTQSTLPDGKIQCKGPFSTVIYNPDGSKTSTIVNGTTVAVDAKGNVAVTTSCSSVLMFMSSPFTCGFRAIVTLLAGSLIYISTWILAAAGTLFNWLMDHTIIQFGTTYGTIKAAVETAWTAFRDVANILIIGIFTFIAISIILGLKEYGQKKMVAKVLIIAVMINFSLLFTKMIIDASNYTAAQIYTAAALGGSTNTQGNAAGAATAGTNYGIADQFMYLLGVQTFGKALKLVDDTAQAKDSGWVALLHGLLVMTVVLGAAMVLFYGCFLLVSRMIMLIFLMGTAAIAFASYLVPKWSDGRFGWSAWWSSLIWCAAFAPILMLLLWMTLNVSYALKGAPGASKATLGLALSDPTGGGNIEALFMYVLVLGLLFGTFKISSMWAGKIGGFSYAQMIPGAGLGIAGAITGLLGRNTLGWGARVARQTMIDRGWTGRGGNEGLMGTARRQAAIAANRLSRTTYNPLKPKLAATAAAALGVPKMLMGKDAIGAQSFEDKMKAKAKHADELARQIQPPEAARNQEAREASERVVEERRRHRELMHQAVTQTETLRAAFQQQAVPQAEQNARQAQPERQNIEQRVQAHQEAVTRAENEKSTAQTRQESEMREAHNVIERAATQARHQAELNTIDERARGHREDLAGAQRELTTLNTAAATLAQQQVDATPQMQEFTRTLREGREGLQDYNQETQRLAREARHEPERARAQNLLWDPRAADDVRSAVRNHERDENLRSLRNILAEGQAQQQPPAQGQAPGNAH